MMDLGVWYSDGSEVMPCPVGGEASVTVTTGEEQRGDTALYDAHWS